MIERLRYEYGAGPLHLLALIASLLLAGYALLRISQIPDTFKILLWIGLAALAHDFVALPLYSLLHRIAEGASKRAIAERERALDALNHLRFPAAFSGLLLLIWFPIIFQIDSERYEITTGVTTEPFLERWLILTAAAFLVSAVLYALRLRGDPAEREPRPGHESRLLALERSPLARSVARIAARATLTVGALVVLAASVIVAYGLISTGP